MLTMTMHTPIKITLPPSPQNVERSLEHYRTVMFGIEIMQERIEINRFYPGEITVATWWAGVPAVYREALVPIIDRVGKQWRGEKLVASTLHGFIRDLNVAIWRDLKPSPLCMEDLI